MSMRMGWMLGSERWRWPGEEWMDVRYMMEDILDFKVETVYDESV